MTLREELDFLQPYLEIEQARLEDRLTVVMKIAPETLDARVPHLLLQPLVENAVRHGIAARIEPGTVEISASRGPDDRFLQLEIRDDGRGMDRDHELGTRRGVGLINIRSRLEQLYGSEHRFKLESQAAGGVLVRITIPFRLRRDRRRHGGEVGPMTIRAAIVDDEPLARRRIRNLLTEAPDVEVIAECANGKDAIESLEESPPDLLFLDIQMPEIDGFDVLQAIGVGHVPVVIFVTAYDQFALRAFEAHALDYLLKPFDDERFGAALQRARERIRQQQGGDLDRRLQALLENVRGDHGYLRRLVVPSGHRSIFVRTEHIDWIEAERNYIRLHVGGRAYLLRENLSHIVVRTGSCDVLPDPPLHHREHRPDPGRRIALPWRVPGGASGWDEAEHAAAAATAASLHAVMGKKRPARRVGPVGRTPRTSRRRSSYTSSRDSGQSRCSAQRPDDMFGGMTKPAVAVALVAFLLAPAVAVPRPTSR